MNDKILKKYAYVNISSYRVKTVKALNGEEKTPTIIAAEAGIRSNPYQKF